MNSYHLNSQYSVNFRKNIRSYNNSLAFASVTPDLSVLKYKGYVSWDLASLENSHRSKVKKYYYIYVIELRLLHFDTILYQSCSCNNRNTK